MKNLILLAMITLASVGMNAQTVKGEGSLMGNVGYQTNYERFGLGVQGRYAIANNLRIAPDVTFYFPKDKITGLDVNVNFHYVFNFKEDGQGFSVYPLAGIGKPVTSKVKKELKESFGANMYDLLRFSFFLKESAIGKVSYEVINSLMDKIMNDASFDVSVCYEQTQINHRNLNKYVKLVGDTFLKNILDKKLGNNVSTENN